MDAGWRAVQVPEVNVQQRGEDYSRKIDGTNSISIFDILSLNIPVLQCFQLVAFLPENDVPELLLGHATPYWQIQRLKHLVSNPLTCGVLITFGLFGTPMKINRKKRLTLLLPCTSPLGQRSLNRAQVPLRQLEHQISGGQGCEEVWRGRPL